MADLSKHRGIASALLAAGAVGLGVVGGASLIVKARGAATPGAQTGTSALPAAGVSTPAASAAGPRRVVVTGLAKWHAAKLPKPLKLAPVVRHGRKIVTVVTPVAVAAGTAPAAKTAAKTPTRHHAKRQDRKSVV